MGNKLIKRKIPALKKAHWFDEHFRKELFYLRSIIRKLPGSIYWKDKNGVYLGCNNLVLTMAGTNNLEDVIGKTDFELPWKEYAPEIYRIDQHVMQSKAPFEIEEYPTLADGRKIIMLTRKVPLQDENGNIEGILGVSVDITDRKKLENDLIAAKENAEAAIKVKTEFLENMRHDIRTPLAGIIGFAKLIEEKTQDHVAKKYASCLIESSYALADLLNEILETIKLNSKELPLAKQKFDFQKRLSDVVHLNQANAKRKNIELIFEHDPAIPLYILGDSKRVHRVVLELISNAINFTHHGSVTLKTTLAKTIEQDLIIKITVEDTGIGIDHKDHEAIFLQFKRLTPSYEGVYQGAGLGLYMVKQYIEELRGEIYVESKIGVGSKFICILPFKKPLLEDDTGIDNTRIATDKLYSPTKMINDLAGYFNKEKISRIKILLIEDHPLAAKVVISFFEDLGCEADAALDGKGGLQLAQNNKYDLILMDIGLPDINGYELTKSIRRFEADKGIDTPIIALSAHTETEHTQNCYNAGMNKVLTKPLKKEDAKDILNVYVPHWQNMLLNKDNTKN